jgi:hypothetical protein
MGGAGSRSMIRAVTPCRANSFAIVKPVGPAPTTSAGTNRSLVIDYPFGEFFKR